MRYITIPADVVLKNPITKEPLPEPSLSFVSYAYEFWFDDPRSIKDGSIAQLRRWNKLVDALETGKPGDVIAVDEEAWTALVAIVENPVKQFASALRAVQFLPFIDAILNAPTVDPSTGS